MTLVHLKSFYNKAHAHNVHEHDEEILECEMFALEQSSLNNIRY